MPVLTISFNRNAIPTLIPSEADNPKAVKIRTVLASWTPTDPGTTKIMNPTSPENASIARLVFQSFGRLSHPSKSDTCNTPNENANRCAAIDRARSPGRDR